MKNRKKIETAIRTISAKLDEALEREKETEGTEDTVIWHMVAKDYELAVSALKKQMEYEELEDQGKLLKLPVWTVNGKPVYTTNIDMRKKGAVDKLINALNMKI